MNVIRRAIRSYLPWMHRGILLSCIGIFVVVVALSFVGNDWKDRSMREVYEPIDLSQVDTDVLKVHTGIYINRIHDVNRASGTFSANGWLWMSWPKPEAEDWWHKEKIDIDLIKFMNEIPNKSKRVKLIDNPIEEFGGQLWHSMQFSSTFLMNNQDFRRFPFEYIELPIEVGTDIYSVDSVVYQPNLKDSLISDRLSLSGFGFRGLEARNFSHTITSKWGHSIDPSSPENKTHWAYPHLEWVMLFGRLPSSSLARLFTPVFAAMVALMFSLLVNLNHSTPKITIPASVLLVLAVLQENSHKMLPPDITYLTYMDKIYMFCYLLTIISFVSSLYCINRIEQAEDAVRTSLKTSLRSQQRSLVNWMSVSLFVVPVILWLL